MEGNLAEAERRLHEYIEEDEDGCWIVTVGVTRLGYSRMMVNYEMDLAHRWAYRVWYGPIPEGKQVNHHCDKRRCVRPRCLYAGTQSENVRDAVRRGRWRGGSPGKLTPTHRDEIRASDEPHTVLARRYGVHRFTIADVRAGRTWKAG